MHCEYCYTNKLDLSMMSASKSCISEKRMGRAFDWTVTLHLSSGIFRAATFLCSK